MAARQTTQSKVGVTGSRSRGGWMSRRRWKVRANKEGTGWRKEVYKAPESMPKRIMELTSWP